MINELGHVGTCNIERDIAEVEDLLRDDNFKSFALIRYALEINVKNNAFAESDEIVAREVDELTARLGVSVSAKLLSTLEDAQLQILAGRGHDFLEGASKLYAAAIEWNMPLSDKSEIVIAFEKTLGFSILKHECDRQRFGTA